MGVQPSRSAHQVLLEAGLGLRMHLGDRREQAPHHGVEVLAGVLEEFEVMAQGVATDLN